MNFVPPLPGLRALEAVARLGSFSAAASELGMTQSAVSQHIKKLEALLDTSLLERQPRKTVPTTAGSTLCHAIQKGLGDISKACESIHHSKQANAKQLVVSCSPGCAVKWIFPRLIDFYEQYPDIRITIHAENHQMTTTTDDIDIAIYYGHRPNLPNVFTEKLFDDYLFPVCAPSYLRTTPLNHPSELNRFTLLCEKKTTYNTINHWDTWLTPLNLDLSQFPDRRYYQQADTIIQAAVSGSGIALANNLIAIDDLVAQRLIMPFPICTPSGHAYYFTCREESRLNHAVMLFKAWLFKQIKQLPPLPSQLNN